MEWYVAQCLVYNLPGRSRSDLVHTASSFTWLWTHKFSHKPALGGIFTDLLSVDFYRTSKEKIHHRTFTNHQADPPPSFSWESQVPGGSISQPWWCAAGISSNATRNQCRWDQSGGELCYQVGVVTQWILYRLQDLPGWLGFYSCQWVGQMWCHSSMLGGRLFEKHILLFLFQSRV